MRLTGGRSGLQRPPRAGGRATASDRATARDRAGALEGGSALALVPAGFLVLVLLASLAVDSAVAYLGQQQLHDALSAAANDAVTAGLDNASFYRSGSLVLDPAAVAQTVCASVAAQHDPGLHHITLDVAIDGDSVRVTASAVVDAVFGKAIPGLARRSVSSSASASLARGPAVRVPAGAGAPQPLQCG